MICPLGYCNNPKCSNKAKCQSQARNMRSRAIQSNQSAYKQQKQDNRSNLSGIYKGYSTQTGLHTVELPDGGTILAKSLSNGYIPQDKMVSVTLSYKSGHGFLYTIPS